jgi:hypothetical protein
LLSPRPRVGRLGLPQHLLRDHLGGEAGGSRVQPGDLEGPAERLSAAQLTGDNPDIAGGSAHLTTADMTTDVKKRRIDAGKSRVVTFKFENNASPTLANYSAILTFGSLSISILP